MVNYIGAILKIRGSSTIYLCIDSAGQDLDLVAVRLSEDPSSDITIESEGKLFSVIIDSHTRIRTLNTECSRISELSAKQLELILRNIVRKDVLTYYTNIHKLKSDLSYVAGDRVPYAGRVFDHEEMLNLSDSCLDFWLTAGPYYQQFERELAKKLGLRYSYLVNSGSSANLLALTALTSPDLGDQRILPGEEVITVAAGFPTTIAPILQIGCIPVFLDVEIERGTYNIDVSQLEAAFSDKTAAVMIAHTLGNPFNLKAVKEFCDKHDLWLVEDNCDALGARYEGKLTGTFGDLATSSFYPPHHLTMGEGGAVYSNNLKLKKAIESFRDWGRDCWCEPGCDNTCGKRFSQQRGMLPFGYDHKYVYRHFGYNLKATDMQAAIGLAQLKKLDSFVDKRRANWNFLRSALSDLEEYFILPSATPDSEPSWFGFALCLRSDTGFSRSDIVSHLEKANIQTRMLFAGNIIRQPCFDGLRDDHSKYRVIDALKNTDKIMNDLFWIGVYPGLKHGMLEYVVDNIRNFLKR